METRNNNPQTTGLQTFLNENIGAEIRTITVDEMLYFVGRDIALSLGYANPVSAIAQHVDNERLSQNETAFFVFAKKIGQVLTSLSQNLPVSLIFCILGNQVKISQR